MAVGIGFSAGPFWAGWRLGGRRRSEGGGPNPFDALDGFWLVLGMVLVITGAWLVVAVLWAVVLGVVALVDLIFAGGRLVWWFGSEQHRAGESVILRWAAVRWLWAAEVTRVIYFWRIWWADRQARRAGLSAYELAVERVGRMGAVSAWLLFGGFLGALFVLFFRLLTFGRGLDRSGVPGGVSAIFGGMGWGYWAAWGVCAGLVVCGVVVACWRGFVRMPLPPEAVGVGEAKLCPVSSASDVDAEEHPPVSESRRASAGGRGASRVGLRHPVG